MHVYRLFFNCHFIDILFLAFLAPISYLLPLVEHSLLGIVWCRRQCMCTKGHAKPVRAQAPFPQARVAGDAPLHTSASGVKG